MNPSTEEHIKKRDKESEQLLESYISVLEQLTTKSSKNKGHIALAKSAAKGNKKAAETIASALLFGDNFPQDIKAAKILLEFLAKEGSSEALRNLGFMNAFGIGFNYNQTKGYRSWEGINTPKSCEPALANYRNVADKMIATFDRDNLFPVDKVRLVYYMEKYGSANVFTDRNLYQYSVFLAGRGNSDAQMILGLLHYTGRNGPALDHYKARYYFTKAARSGNTKALAFLGEMYFKGSVATPQNNITAMKYYSAAAELGDPLGLYGLGLIYLQGKGVPVNYNEAFRYLNESAARGLKNAQAQLGLMYYNGLGLTKDYETAYRYFEMASEGRDPLAIFYMAQMYSTGTGVPRSCQNAVQLYKYFCELGSWSEMFLSAYKDYERGQIESALVQYLLLAEIGYEVAQSNAAYILESGQVSFRAICVATNPYTGTHRGESVNHCG
ncbi:protein sel-1 homolog 2-like [Spea bombifrons]|uniref:protein sel-1 homolog 2-like n=1 Tax=Spea bombifrons TaxID=233779 RepID=UPI00234BBD08|nr:protein sel-1 homolog 2-like [Spea bombifrons]